MRLFGALRPSPPAGPLLASALLLGLAFPPFHLVLPSFVGLAPLAAWVARLPDGAAGRSAALRGGFVTGLLAYGLLLHWLATALLRHTLLGLPAFLVTVPALAGLVALVALGLHQSVRRLGLPVWVALPILWTGAEWLRGHLGPLSFPWLGLGESLTGYPILVGGADLVGSRGIGLWLALCNGLVAESALRLRPRWAERHLPSPPPSGRGAGGSGRREGTAWPTALLGAVLVVQLGYSAWRWRTLELRPAARVAVVQPDVSQEVKMRGAPAVDSAVASARRLVDRELAGAADLDLVVLPETVFPTVVDRVPALGFPGRPDLRAFVSGTAERLDAPVLYGAVGVDAAAARPRFHNSAFLRSAGGERIGRYDKRRLVPLFERGPLGPALPPTARAGPLLRPGVGGYAPGPRRPPLPAGASRFGVLICFEAVFAEAARDHRRRGADFLVNVTNDAWLGGDDGPWSRSSGLWQHPAHLVMRAVENRVGVVRAANTGISQTVDPLGRVGRSAPPFEPAAFTATVATSEGPTVYARWGDVAGKAAALASAGVALACAIARRRRDRIVDGGDA